MVLAAAGWALGLGGAGASLGCTTVDPGPNFVVEAQTFNANYFYCHVEPEYIVANKCGPGDPTKGDPSTGCHFNSAYVSGMVLVDHPPIDCGGGDTPVDPTQIVQAATGNLQAASLEMSSDVPNAPILVRPSGNSHPRAVVSKTDPNILNLLETWASK